MGKRKANRESVYKIDSMHISEEENEEEENEEGISDGEENEHFEVLSNNDSSVLITNKTFLYTSISLSFFKYQLFFITSFCFFSNVLIIGRNG